MDQIVFDNTLPMTQFIRFIDDFDIFSNQYY